MACFWSFYMSGIITQVWRAIIAFFYCRILHDFTSPLFLPVATLRSRRVSDASHDATENGTGPMSHGPFWSKKKTCVKVVVGWLRLQGRPRHFQPLGIEPLMKASIKNRMVPQAPRKQWLACRDQWWSVDQGWCQAWFGMQVPFFCQTMSNSDNSGNEMIISNWPFWLQKKYGKKTWEKIEFDGVLHVLKKAWVCRAVLLGWFKINAGLVRQIPWSLTKAQEEAAAKSNGWILGITVRHPLEGPGGFNEFGVWAIRHHTAIACHSQIRILGITSGQIWLRLRFFRICGDPWSWKAGIMLYPRCIQMFLSGRVHIQSFLWKNKRTLQHFAGCKRMRYEFLPKAVGHIYIYII